MKLNADLKLKAGDNMMLDVKGTAIAIRKELEKKD
jgi:hypothetical protein